MPADPTLDVEREFFESGARCVIGVDEVGRGAIAGPVVVGVSVIRNLSDFPAGLRDSKLLSVKRRDALVEPVREWVDAIDVGEASAIEVDEFGIVSALARAAERAFAKLAIAGHDIEGAVVLLDGTHNWLKGALVPPLDIRVRAKADRDCAVVAAASVFAKVYRDDLMVSAGGDDDIYGWASNRGYGSENHFAAIRQNGVTSLHRRTWIRDASVGADGE